MARVITDKDIIDWLKMEKEIRKVLGKVSRGEYGGYSEEDQLFAGFYCIDEIVAFHTRRGNEMECTDRDREDFKREYPQYFDRKW